MTSSRGHKDTDIFIFTNTAGKFWIAPADEVRS